MEKRAVHEKKLGKYLPNEYWQLKSFIIEICHENVKEVANDGLRQYPADGSDFSNHKIPNPRPFFH